MKFKLILEPFKDEPKTLTGLSLEQVEEVLASNFGAYRIENKDLLQKGAIRKTSVHHFNNPASFADWAATIEVEA